MIFFVGFDKFDLLVFVGDDYVVCVYGVIIFIEVWNGYFEVGYVFFDDWCFL